MKTPKQIGCYTHTQDGAGQVPDIAPGPFYITAKDGPDFWLLSGPYDQHAEALSLVEKARRLANEADGRSHWYAFGTVRMKPEVATPGNFQKCGFTLQLERTTP